SRSFPDERPLEPRRRLRELTLPARRNGCNDLPLKSAAGSRPIAACAHRTRRFAFAQPPKSACRAHCGRPATAFGPDWWGRTTSTRGTGWAQAGDPLQDLGEQLPRHRDFCQLEGDVLGAWVTTLAPILISFSRSVVSV